MIEKNLFLTGLIGCGKSTNIAGALGELVSRAGGFQTLRQREEAGQAVSFWIQKPDGSCRRCFLDCSETRGVMHMEVFESFGTELLEQAKQCDYVILDEIGGFEVLSDVFMEALMALLKSEIPCIGVMKGEGPAGSMISRLGLGDAYAQKTEALRNWMRHDENTLLYRCGRFDPEGLRLAREWVRTYCGTDK